MKRLGVLLLVAAGVVVGGMVAAQTLGASPSTSIPPISVDDEDDAKPRTTEQPKPRKTKRTASKPSATDDRHETPAPPVWSERPETETPPAEDDADEPEPTRPARPKAAKTQAKGAKAPPTSSPRAATPIRGAETVAPTPVLAGDDDDDSDTETSADTDPPDDVVDPNDDVGDSDTGD